MHFLKVSAYDPETTITVTGATGHLGKLILDSLKGHDVRGVARRPEEAGSGARYGDYDKPESLVEAFEGSDVLVFISASDVGRRLEQHRTVVEAAAAAKVGRIVYTSITRADTNPIPISPEHLATEEHIRSTGVPFTFLRNNWYLENYTGNLAATLEHGVVLGSAGDGRIAGATRADFAAAAAVVASTDGHDNAIYELGGDHAFTLTEFAEALARRFQTPVSYRDLPVEEYARTLEGFGVPDRFAEILAKSDAEIAKGALDVVTGELSRLLGRPTTTLDEFLATL
ncbi:SDR family oxidoreductase [Dactylosporangium salmoneum]|uniref:SDR family oxidoreductase n=1 Tax=Dactylosporangium salmoneum TaxID=53361 RepID=A0ABP5SBT5_9ACTN